LCFVVRVEPCLIEFVARHAVKTLAHGFNNTPYKFGNSKSVAVTCPDCG
jgi:hypothetical protein